jgi:hypothetical protein
VSCGSPAASAARFGSVLHGALLRLMGLAALPSFPVEYHVHPVAFGDEHWWAAAQAQTDLELVPLTL